MATDDSRVSARDGLLTQILTSKAFARIPRENLKGIVSKIEMLPVTAGETIIRQGEVGDSFYILRDGRCRVVSYMSVEDATVEIATLGPGDSFGEEALIRGAPRNATVEMLSDGSLARLVKQDFVELIQGPLLQGVDPATAQAMVAKGATVLDVRSSVDYGSYCIPGSRNIPLDFLRTARRGLDAGKIYITCSDKELEAALATFLLAQKGFDARYLSATVAEYLRATGDYDKDTVTLPGADEDKVIELPEEYMKEALRPATVDIHTSIDSVGSQAAPQREMPVGDPIAQLRQEFKRALDEQRQRHNEDMRSLKEEVAKLLEARAKALSEDFRLLYTELVRKITALSQK